MLPDGIILFLPDTFNDSFDIRFIGLVCQGTVCCVFITLTVKPLSTGNERRKKST